MKRNYYFETDSKYWLQHIGTAMGSPISSIVAGIFLQQMEEKYYPDLIKSRHIKYNHTSAEQILLDHYQIHKNMKYTLEKESDQILNFLDLKIHRVDNKLTLCTNQKPKQTDTIIH
jgi:hypothetical protein